MRGLVVAMVLALSTNALASAPPPELADAAAAHAAGELDAEGNALIAVIDNPRAASAHAVAWRQYADLLAAHELPQAAVLAYAQALATDPSAMSERLTDALQLAALTQDTDALGRAALTADLSALSATPARSQLALAAVRAAIHAQDYDAAAQISELVTPSDPSYAEARVLRGVALANQQAYGQALAALLVADAAVDPSDRALRDLVKINLARAYYAAGNPLKAIEHYVSVSRQGDQWVSAHWERAWAHFSVDDMSGALSLLRAYQTPYLQDRYLAEGDMLRIYSLFVMCKFPSARTELDAFKTRYTPLRSELDRSLTDLDSAAAYSDLLAFSAGQPTRLPTEVFQASQTDQRARRAIAAVSRMQQERTAAAAHGQLWGQRAAEQLSARSDTLIDEQGSRVLARAHVMADELREWLGSSDLTRLDIMGYETKLLERAAITGEVDLGDRLGEIRRLRQRRGTRVWPASDEVWADEVGYESVRTRSDCREDIL